MQLCQKLPAHDQGQYIRWEGRERFGAAQGLSVSQPHAACQATDCLCGGTPLAWQLLCPLPQQLLCYVASQLLGQLIPQDLHLKAFP